MADSSSPPADGPAPAAVREEPLVEEVKDKEYWRKRREARNKLPEHECAKLQQRALACSSVAGDVRHDVCAEAFAAYKDCMQESKLKRAEERAARGLFG